MKKVELLAPAGNREKLSFAIEYGADAVYLGVKDFSLRAAAGSFRLSELAAAAAFAHRRGVKVYAALNIFAHNRDFAALPAVLSAIREAEVDALIISDPGVFLQVRRELPALPVHISTQANTTNRQAAEFWRRLGARRVILARELSLAEIREIAAAGLTVEVFVHGALCISYSGRCFLSRYLADRDANQGDCAHSCRWKYYLSEEKRPGRFYPVLMDERGSYIFNSHDLALAERVPQLIKAGVGALKVEGRMKSLHYTATVVRTYRSIIDAYYAEGDDFYWRPRWTAELAKVSHRPYISDFPTGAAAATAEAGYIRNYKFVGVAAGRRADGWLVKVRNRISCGDELEVLTPNGSVYTFTLKEMYRDGLAATTAHANSTVVIKSEAALPPMALIRRPSAGPSKDVAGEVV